MKAATRSMELFATALLSMVLASCDDTQAWQEPDPTLARMLSQRRADPYQASRAFDDGKSMRDPPRGTVPRDADLGPPIITRSLLAEGRERYETTCATCHGIAGNGESVVATKMQHRPPPTLHRPRSREQMYGVVTEGYGLMPSFAAMLTAKERWAVVAYVQALQLSRRVRASDLPSDIRAELEKASAR